MRASSGRQLHHFAAAKPQQSRKLLTLGGAVDDFVLLLRVLEDALGAEVLPAHHAVELYLLLRMLPAVHDLGLWDLARVGLGVLCGHRKARQNLVIHWQVVWADLMITLVIWALDHAVLGKFARALATEGVTAGQRHGLFVVVVVRLEADAALKYRIHFCWTLRFLC